MTLCVIDLLFCVIKLCFTSTYLKKPLFPSYRLREWAINNMYYRPKTTNEPLNEKHLNTQKKPNQDNIELKRQLLIEMPPLALHSQQ